MARSGGRCQQCRHGFARRVEGYDALVLQKPFWTVEPVPVGDTVEWKEEALVARSGAAPMRGPWRGNRPC